ncbi:MAG: hypothetical protein J6Z25_00030 [Opitutales bacterium]|nr:hypothetical protein [Opitutales bacterium]
MSIEGNILASALDQSNAQNAYQQSLTTADNLETDPLANLPEDVPQPETIAARHPVQLNADATTPGEVILNTIQSISDAHANVTHALSEVTKGLNDKDTLNMADAVKMQVGVMKWQLQNELMSKVAGSLSNGVQTLMRNQ